MFGYVSDIRKLLEKHLFKKNILPYCKYYVTALEKNVHFCNFFFFKLHAVIT